MALRIRVGPGEGVFVPLPQPREGATAAEYARGALRPEGLLDKLVVVLRAVPLGDRLFGPFLPLIAAFPGEVGIDQGREPLG